LTLENAAINIGKTEWQGLTFTAIFQVKSLLGFLFQPPLQYDRYEMMGKCVGVYKRKYKENKLISIIM
jgi:hypothetical protein